MELPQPTMPVPTEIIREGDRVILKAAICFKPRRGRSEIIDGRTGTGITAQRTSPDPALIQTIVQAEFWRSEIDRRPDDALQEITEEHGIKPTYVRRLLNAAYLAPAIKRAVFQ
jgi:hypothetical protein